MNLSAQEYLAKLLAKENLTVQHGNYQTASFDVINRVLRLPLWADKGKDVYDLLVGHEVGHALFTPSDGWHDAENKIAHIPKAYLNIVEDIRIERKIQESYPGIVRRFKAGYKVLFDDNLFGTDDRDINEAGLMDRLNVSSKGRGYVPVEFSDDESPLIKEAMKVQTWDDVVVVCQKLYDFIEQQKEEKEDEEELNIPMNSPSNGSREADSEEGEAPTPDATPSNDEPQEDESPKDDSVSSGDGEKQEETDSSDSSHETWTEDTFREKEEELLQQVPNPYSKEVSQAKFSSGVSDLNVKAMVYPYKEAQAMREEYIATKINSPHLLEYCPYTSAECREDFNATKKTYKSQANLIAKDFERKKAAFEYQRATTAKSGKLDPLKMHAYKTSEDIFLTTTQLAQAKSHGIMMFLDLSGSMADIVSDVVAQAITIAMFCRQVGIPFEAYSFTSTSMYRHSNEGMSKGWSQAPSELECDNTKIVELLSSKMNKKTFDEAAYTIFAIGKAHHHGHSELECDNTKIVELLSSKMNKKTFDEAAYTIFAIGKAHHHGHRQYRIYPSDIHSIDQMGSTPLVQTLYAVSKLTKAFTRKHAIQNTNIMMLTDGALTKAFTRKHAIQNTNIMMLTDGAPDGLYITDDPLANVRTNRNNMSIKFEGKMIQGSNSRLVYEGMLIRLKEVTGATVMGFHLASEASTFGGGYHGIDENKDFPAVLKAWRKEGFSHFKNEKGYDDYFIIKINKASRFDSDEFAPKKVDTIGDLKREFKKFNKTKKGNKQLVARITDAVAA